MSSEISTELFDDLTNFLGEVQGIADLMMAAGHCEVFEVSEQSMMSVASGLYSRAGEMKNRLVDGDGGES